MRTLVNVLLVVAALVAALLGWKLLAPTAPTPPAPAPVVIETRCDEERRAPPPLRADLVASTLVVLKPADLTVTLDERTAGGSVSPGLHVVEAEGVRVQVRVEPFAPVVIDARVVNDIPTVFIAGATCVTCVVAPATLDLNFTGEPSSLLGILGALAKHDWALAVKQLRGVNPQLLETPDYARLVAIAYWQAGQPGGAKKWLARLGKRDPLVRALAEREEEESHLADRQLVSAPARWNALTERYQRVTDAFVTEVPLELTQQFDGYTRRLTGAMSQHNAVEAELVLREATTTLDAAIARLRELHSDCTWQHRVDATL